MKLGESHRVREPCSGGLKEPLKGQNPLDWQTHALEWPSRHSSGSQDCALTSNHTSIIQYMLQKPNSAQVKTQSGQSTLLFELCHSNRYYCETTVVMWPYHWLIHFLRVTAVYSHHRPLLKRCRKYLRLKTLSKQKSNTQWAMVSSLHLRCKYKIHHFKDVDASSPSVKRPLSHP